MGLEFDICQTKLWSQSTKMDRLVTTKRIKIVKTYYKNDNDRWTTIFRTKFSSAIKHISHSVGTLITEIVAFGRFWESSSNWRETTTSRKSHCLVRSLLRSRDWLKYRRKCVKKWSKNTSNTTHGGHLNDVVFHT